jgi:hypothetical protein
MRHSYEQADATLHKAIENDMGRHVADKPWSQVAQSL